MSRRSSLALRCALPLFVLTLLACGTVEDVFRTNPSTGGAGPGGEGGSALPTTRVDLLLVIDNSRSMADKQEILSLAVPGLVQSLANPRCLDPQGIPADTQPATPDEDCPTGTARQFPPVQDMHVGVITSSIGGHGADSCSGATEPTENDQAHLISRMPGGGNVSTYQSYGFLAWDPGQGMSPPGEDDPATLAESLTNLVVGAGQVGCGFEAPLESWYRFLCDPDPYETITVENGAATPQGTDQVLLQQRKDFLRPGSLLAIVVLSDESDCSLRDGGQYYYAAQLGTGSGIYHLPRAQSACAADPADACCRSCGQAAGPGCPPKGPECATPYDQLGDHANLRCWDQKRRFGIDFLYPVDRYVAGLTAAELADRNGNVVPNPIFSDLDPSDGESDVRDPGLVVLASIQGVPWQDIARQNSAGVPDLEQGLDAAGHAVGAFQSAAELESGGVWNVILGDPSGYYASAADRPDDPLMIASVDPRSGSNPVTDDPLAPPGADTMANPINGHEYSIPLRNDLQYACIFPLAAPRDCSSPEAVTCDCVEAANNSPLCQDPSGNYGTIQYRAKAYPGLRQLELVRALESRGVVGSICPAQTGAPSAVDFGYAPTVRSLLEAMQSRLAQP
jgi:hypothetical protein